MSSGAAGAGPFLGSIQRHESGKYGGHRGEGTSTKIARSTCCSLSPFSKNLKLSRNGLRKEESWGPSHQLPSPKKRIQGRSSKKERRDRGQFRKVSRTQNNFKSDAERISSLKLGGSEKGSLNLISSANKHSLLLTKGLQETLRREVGSSTRGYLSHFASSEGSSGEACRNVRISLTHPIRQ